MNGMYSGSGQQGSVQNASRIKEYRAEAWTQIHAEVSENEVFYSGDTRAFIEEIITSGFTDNAKAIPPVDLNITEWIIVNVSTLYIGRDQLSDHQGEIPPKYVDSDSYKEALQEASDSYFLNGAGFIYIHKGKTGEISFKSIKPFNIVYDYNFNKVCVQIGIYDEQRYVFEYYEKQSNGKVKGVTFIANDFFSASNSPLTLGKREKEVLLMRELGSFDSMPIIPMFRLVEKICTSSPIARLHKFLVVIVGFALAGVPMSVFVKLYLKTNSMSSDAMSSAFADMMAILNLKEGDDIGVVDTGKGEAFINYLVIMESLLSLTAQMMGVSKTAVGNSVKEVRKSGASKYQDNLTALNFRRRRVNKWDKYERNIFKSLKLLRKSLSSFNFRPIDKDNESLLFDPESLQSYLIEGVSNGLIPLTNAVAIKYGLTPTEAEKLTKTIKKEIKTYDTIYNAMGVTPEKKELAGGLKKGDLKGNNYQNEQEYDGNSNQDNPI